jgi:hypothetical protein
VRKLRLGRSNSSTRASITRLQRAWLTAPFDRLPQELEWAIRICYVEVPGRLRVVRILQGKRNVRQIYFKAGKVKLRS